MKVKRFTLNPTKNLLKKPFRYKVKGNKLIVTTYNKKGKLTEERSFKRLSEDDVKKLDYDYERDVRADKKRFQKLVMFKTSLAGFFSVQNVL